MGEQNLDEYFKSIAWKKLEFTKNPMWVDKSRAEGVELKKDLIIPFLIGWLPIHEFNLKS